MGIEIIEIVCRPFNGLETFIGKRPRSLIKATNTHSLTCAVVVVVVWLGRVPKCGTSGNKLEGIEQKLKQLGKTHYCFHFMAIPGIALFNRNFIDRDAKVASKFSWPQGVHNHSLKPELNVFSERLFPRFVVGSALPGQQERHGTRW